jgi:carbon monoxide dehydrogenase subunit G
MEISKTFVIRTPPETAWQFLTDPRRVASCLPGAAITGQRDERTHDGTMTVRVGPVSATYRGTLRFERLDPEGRTAEISATGQDVRGKGGAQMRMTSRLVERAPGETEVTVVSQVDVMGVLAQFGRGMIQDVSDQLFARFVDAMRSQLELPVVSRAIPPVAAATDSTGVVAGATRWRALATDSNPATPAPAPSGTAASVEPLDLLSLGSGAVGRALVRAVQRPAVWAAVAGLFAAAVGYRWMRRRHAPAPAEA